MRGPFQKRALSSPVLNRLRLGPDLAINGAFGSSANWAVGSGWAIASAKATCTDFSASLTNDAAAAAIRPVQGRGVIATWEVLDFTSGTLYARFGAGVAASFSPALNGLFEQELAVGASATGIEFYGGAFRGSVRNVVVRAII